MLLLGAVVADALAGSSLDKLLVQVNLVAGPLVDSIQEIVCAE